MATYVVRTRGVPSAAGNALIALHNGVDSGKVVEIRAIRLDMHFSTDPALTGTITAGDMQLRRITSCSGGTPIEYAKLDSANDDLPSDVLVMENPSCTVTGGPIQSLVTNPCFKPDFGLSGMSIHVGASRSGMHFGEMFRQATTGAGPIVLREDEGLALYIATAIATFAYRYSVVFRDQASGDTYVVDDEVSTLHQGQFAAAIFNGNSSTVLEVLEVSLHHIGDTSLPAYLVTPIDGIDPRTGEVLSAIKMDSSSANVPSGLVFKRDCVVYGPGTSQGMPSSVFGSYAAVGKMAGGLNKYVARFLGAASWNTISYTHGPSNTLTLSGSGTRMSECLPPRTSIQIFPGFGIAMTLAAEDTYFTAAPSLPIPASCLGVPDVRIIFTLSDAPVKGSAS